MTYLAPDGDLTALASYCGIKTPTAAIMADLAEDVAAAVAAVEDDPEFGVGPVESTTATVTLRAPQAAIVAPWRVASITSYVPAGGAAMLPSAFDIDGHLVTRADGATIPPGVLTYTTGYAAGSIPPALVIVGKQILRQLWRARIGNPRAEGEPGVGVLWPRQAQMLAAPYRLAPLGFA